MKIKININEKFVLPAYRHFVFENNQKFQVLIGGVGSGKSFAVAIKILSTCLKSKRHWMILRKYGTSLEDSVISLMLYLIEMFQLGGFVYYNKTMRKIKFKNGSTILFKGYDDPEKVKSIFGLTDIFCEESTEFSSDDWLNIKERLRGCEDGHFLLSFNPIDANHWIRTEFFDPDNNPLNPLTTYILKTTFRDNPYYGIENVRTLMELKATHPNRFAVSANAEWGVLGSLIFEDYKKTTLPKIESMYDGISYGLDFGFKHKTCLSCVGKSGNRLCVLDEIYADALDTNDLIEVIKKKYAENEKWRFIPIIADNSRPEAISQMKKAGFNIRACIKGDGSVFEGLQWMKEHEIWIDESCQGILTEITAYQWKKDKKTNVVQPTIDKATAKDDSLDSFRYACESFRFRHKNEVRF